MKGQAIIRNFVTFEADFPDDSEWDANENLIVPGGRALAVWLREQFHGRGFEFSEVSQCSFYGWRFVAKTCNGFVECILQGGHPWLLILEPKSSLLRKVIGHGDNSVLEAVVSAMHEILTNSPQFSFVRWFTRKDYESGKKHLGKDTPYY